MKRHLAVAASLLTGVTAVAALGTSATSEAAVTPRAGHGTNDRTERGAAPLRLVYDRFDGLATLRSAALDGSDVVVRQPSSTGYMAAVQSPDRQRFAVSFAEPRHVGVTGALGGPGDESVLTGFANTHAWTTDGDEVLVGQDISSETVQRYRLVAAAADGGSTRVLDDPGPGGPLFGVVGANDEDVLYRADQGDGSAPELRTVPLAGGTPVPWTAWDDATIAPHGGPVFALRRVPGAYQLVRLAPGANSTTLVHEFPNRQVFYPTWSASGGWFAVAGRAGGKSYVLLANAAGTVVKKLGKLPGRTGSIARPSLSPDGKVLAYRVASASTTQDGLWLRDLTLNRTCRMVKPAQASFAIASFTPDGRQVVVTDDNASRIVGRVTISRPGGAFRSLDLGGNTYVVGFAGGSDTVADAVPCPKD